MNEHCLIRERLNTTDTTDMTMEFKGVVNVQGQLLGFVEMHKCNSSAATSQHLSCRFWTIATPCWPVFQLPRWHRSCGNLVVRAADTSTNWRQSLFCCWTASMEQAADGAKTAAIDGLVPLWSENISVSFCQAPGYRLIMMRPRSSSRGRNTSASVTVTVTVPRYRGLLVQFSPSHSLAVKPWGNLTLII